MGFIRFVVQFDPCAVHAIRNPFGSYSGSSVDFQQALHPSYRLTADGDKHI